MDPGGCRTGEIHQPKPVFSPENRPTESSRKSTPFIPGSSSITMTVGRLVCAVGNFDEPPQRAQRSMTDNQFGHKASSSGLRWPTERPGDTGASRMETTLVLARNKNNRLLSCPGSANCAEEPASESNRDRPVHQRKNEGLDHVGLHAPSLGQDHIACPSLPVSPRPTSSTMRSIQSVA